ncbi:MAG: hypothetical protein ACI4TX_01165 [Christensenellales bacterium]
MKISTIKKIRLFNSHKNQSEKSGLHKNFWFVDNGQEYMFKFPVEDKQFMFSLINEVFISKMCEKLGVNCQNATFAQYGLNKQKGVIVKSFLQGNQKAKSVEMLQKDYIATRLDEVLGKDYFEKYIYPIINQRSAKIKAVSNYADTVIDRFSVKEMQQDVTKKLEFLQHFYLQVGTISDISNCFSPFAFDIVKQNHMEIDYLSNIENRNPTDKDLIEFVKIYASKYNLKLPADLEEQICVYGVFDFLTIQDDRNTHNLSFIIDGNMLKLAPLFDNEMCFANCYNSNKFELCKNKIANNILLTDLTKSKLNNKDSLVYKCKESLQTFLNNGYDEFVKEFLANYKESVDYIFKDKPALSNDEKLEFLAKYFLNAKASMQFRLEQLEKNKNINENINMGILENEPLQKQNYQHEKL